MGDGETVIYYMELSKLLIGRLSIPLSKQSKTNAEQTYHNYILQCRYFFITTMNFNTNAI
jgi:hypothetical protein